MRFAHIFSMDVNIVFWQTSCQFFQKPV